LRASRRRSKSRTTRARAAAQLLSEFAVGDLEASHRRPTLFGVVGGRGTVFVFERARSTRAARSSLSKARALGIGNGTGRVLRLDPVIDERINQELFAHVFEEVLRSPALEPAVGELDVAGSIGW